MLKAFGHYSTILFVYLFIIYYLHKKTKLVCKYFPFGLLRTLTMGSYNGWSLGFVLS